MQPAFGLNEKESTAPPLDTLSTHASSRSQLFHNIPPKTPTIATTNITPRTLALPLPPCPPLNKPSASFTPSVDAMAEGSPFSVAVLVDVVVATVAVENMVLLCTVSGAGGEVGGVVPIELVGELDELVSRLLLDDDNDDGSAEVVFAWRLDGTGTVLSVIGTTVVDVTEMVWTVVSVTIRWLGLVGVSSGVAICTFTCTFPEVEAGSTVRVTVVVGRVSVSVVVALSAAV